MPTLSLCLPAVEKRTTCRPDHCPHCNCELLQGWGRVTKPIQDLNHRQAEVHRYRCCDCGRTFRAYPTGVERRNRSRQVRYLAAVTCALGLSLDHAVEVFESLGVSISRTSIWRDSQEMIPPMISRKGTRQVEVLGERWNHSMPGMACEEVTLIVELGQEKTIELGVFDERGANAACAWLKTLADELGVEIRVLD